MPNEVGDANTLEIGGSKTPPKKITTCGELAEALLEWRKLTTAKDRAQIVAGIKEARRHMNNEHLH